MKLGTKFNLFFLVIIASFIVVGGVAIFVLTKVILERSLGENRRFLVQEQFDKIDRQLYARYKDIEKMSSYYYIREFLVNYKKYLNNGTYKQEFEKTNELLYEDYLLVNEWDSLMLVDMSGKILAGNDEQDIGKDVGFDSNIRVAYKSVIDSGRLYYSDIVVSKDATEKTIIFAVPVRNTHEIGHPIVGAIMAKLSWPVLSEIINNLPFTITLFNKDHEVIATSIKKSDPSVIDQTNVCEIIETLVSNPSNYFVGHDPNDNIENLLVYSEENGYLDFDGNGWLMIMEQNTGDAFAQAYQLAIRIMILFLSISLLFIIAIRLFFEWIYVKPLVVITNATKKVADGKLGQNIPVKSNDELGDLAKFFNIMVVKLKSSYSGLERKVKYRTKELSEKLEIIEQQKQEAIASHKKLLNLTKNLNIEKNNLAHAKAKDDALLASIGEGLVFTDMQGNIILGNQVLMDIFECTCSMEEMREKNWFKDIAVTNEEGAEISLEDRPMYRISKNPEIESVKATYIYQVKKRSKRKIPVHITATIVMVNNEPIGLLGILRDVTVERQVDKAKSEFVRIASHQLRTPLSTINWCAEMLQEIDGDKFDEETKQCVGQIYTSGVRMNNLVNSLLAISRIEAGNFTVDLQTCDFNQAIENVIEKFSNQIEEKQTNLIFSPGELPPIKADRSFLNIVVESVLANAIMYTPNQGNVTVETHLLKRKYHEFAGKKISNCYLFVVKDNGYGIPKKQQDQIFTKMFRADNILKYDTTGAGLSLYIVKAVLENFGGSIWFESVEGEGTTFYISIPLSGMKKHKNKIKIFESPYQCDV